MTDVYKSCGVGTDALTGKTTKVLSTYNSSLANAKGAFVVSGSNYQVTAGKIFYITGLWPMSVGSYSAKSHIVYADNSSFTTNLVYTGISYIGNSTIGQYQQPFPIPAVQIPASKYVGVYQSDATASACVLMLIGYEA